jgi:hypothetical protein
MKKEESKTNVVNIVDDRKSGDVEGQEEEGEEDWLRT